MIVVWGAFLGFISVAFGAFAEHGLRANLTAEHFDFIMTAVRYNQINAVIISAIGLAILSSGNQAYMRALFWSGVLFIIGTLLFSFSIYLSVVLSMPSLTRITPTGGITLMLAWLSLSIAALVAVKNKQRK